MIDDDDDIHIVDMRRMHDELHYDYVYDARCIYSYRYINIQAGRTPGGANIEIFRFAPRATSSQGSFLLMNVRSDEKTARRTVIWARNADIRTVARETPDARPANNKRFYFLKKGVGMRPSADPPGPSPPPMAIWII